MKTPISVPAVQRADSRARGQYTAIAPAAQQSKCNDKHITCLDSAGNEKCCKGRDEYCWDGKCHKVPKGKRFKKAQSPVHELVFAHFDGHSFGMRGLI
jgi:hypothetical protein